ncbi:MAG: hypothetical protein M3R08_04455, partial [Bacteroidota bacterium]|nr:hypothetical protein [Bacteroidota bacterium]
ATKNLENWPSLDFKAFLQELKKLKISLSLSEEAEWMGYFNEQKAKAQALQAQIDRTESEIDRMVYAMYGLREEEVGVVVGREVEFSTLYIQIYSLQHISPADLIGLDHETKHCSPFMRVDAQEIQPR